MASTTFVDNSSIIYASWLNDINATTYNGTFISSTITPSNLVCNGSVSGTGFTGLVNNTLSAPGQIGNGTPNTGAFTTLSTSGLATLNSLTVSGATTLVTPNLGTPSTLVGTNITGTANALNAGIGVNQTWQNVLSNRNDTVLTAGSFVIGNLYTILTVGTTNFTLIGASSNTVGVVFTATGAGSGTGTARNTYQNTTGKPIVVNVMTDQGTNFGSTITATISGVSFTIGIDSNSNGGHNAVGNVIVPNNATYMIVASGNGVSGFDEWVELR